VRLILGSKKYGPSLVKMGLKHGKDFDCMTEECPVCEPYRERDREEWQMKLPEQRHLGVIGMAKDSIAPSYSE